MKVFDLQCANRHAFEGWFGSEDDYQSQHARAMVACPFCGNQEVTKKLSAPRLNLSGNHTVTEQPVEVLVANNDSTALTAAWLAAARHVLANSTDVGGRFAEEARRMHYGEVEERSIRGKTTPDEAMALMEEGIAVMPLILPDAAKETLQ